MDNDKNISLKSAYDLAMERLAKRDGQSRPLSDEQKKAVAEIEQKAKAKVAELEIMLQAHIARTGDDQEKLEKLKTEHQIEIAKIREKAQEKKERIRGDSAPE